MLMDYLRKHHLDERGFMDKFKKFIESDHEEYKGYPERRNFRMDRKGEEWPMEDSIMNKDFHTEYSAEHFIPSEAKYIVSGMFHTENGKRCTGEKYSMEKAKEVCERYRGFIPSSINHVDIYVAINAQYHDYACLFKTWFGDRIDYKIIESAIVFWFKDEDNPGISKLIEYFRVK